MDFEIDAETYRDLGVFNAGTGKSLVSIIDKTKTKGGEVLLLRMMQEPTNDVEALTARTELIKFFYTLSFDFKISYHEFDVISHYISLNKKCLGNNVIDAVYDHYNYKINPSQDYYNISSGIKELIKLISTLRELIREMADIKIPPLLRDKFMVVETILEDNVVVKNLTRKKPITAYDINYLDNLFRKDQKSAVKKIIDLVCEIDVYLALASLIKTEAWCFPNYMPGKTSEVVFEGLYHPAITQPVENDFEIARHTNVIFLTGPNMAGKSSFLKAVGISIYLAHLGFPIPARRFKTTVFNGLITTINLPDNIQEGLSHFYSEAKRIPKTAEKLLDKGELIVIFDELFRGTNLKDAFEATLSLITILAEVNLSKFIISGHFAEIVEDLKKVGGISFYCFNCRFENEQPVFSYKLKDGISEDRLGMYILNNETIFSKLEELVAKQNARDRVNEKGL